MPRKISSPTPPQRCCSGRTCGPRSLRRRSGAQAASSSRSAGFHTTPSWKHARPCSPLPGPQPHRRLEMFRRGGGLVRAAATTAVVAGTAGAVRHHQDQKYAAQDQAAYDQQVAAQQAYAAPPPAAPAAPSYAAELEQLAQLKNQGIISDEEFEAKKKQILGI